MCLTVYDLRGKTRWYNCLCLYLCGYKQPWPVVVLERVGGVGLRVGVSLDTQGAGVLICHSS